MNRLRSSFWRLPGYRPWKQSIFSGWLSVKKSCDQWLLCPCSRRSISLEGAYDVFVTGDKNLRYQQNLAGRRLAIVELPTNRWPLLRPLETKIIAAVDESLPSSYTIVPAS